MHIMVGDEHSVKSTKQRSGGGWRRARACVSWPAHACSVHKCGRVCMHTCVWRVCTQGGQEGVLRRVASGQSLLEEGWPSGGICTKNFLDGERPGGPLMFRELGGLHRQKSKGEPLPAPAKGSGKA